MGWAVPAKQYEKLIEFSLAFPVLPLLVAAGVWRRRACLQMLLSSDSWDVPIAGAVCRSDGCDCIPPYSKAESVPKVGSFAYPYQLGLILCSGLSQNRAASEIE